MWDGDWDMRYELEFSDRQNHPNPFIELLPYEHTIIFSWESCKKNFKTISVVGDFTIW